MDNNSSYEKFSIELITEIIVFAYQRIQGIAPYGIKTMLKYLKYIMSILLTKLLLHIKNLFKILLPIIT